MSATLQSGGAENAGVAGQTESPGPEIHAVGVTKSFDDERVLQGIDLSVGRGDTLVLFGRSGSGKSVLMKILAGLMAPDAGTVTVDGAGIHDLGPSARRNFADRFGMLFQQGGLFDSLPVWENVAFGPLIEGAINHSEAHELAAAGLAAVGLGTDVLDLYPAELSGGMQKRVALARAVTGEPDLLFLDDPTAGLDPIMCSIIHRMIRDNLARTRATAVIVTSDMLGARRMATHLALLSEGRITWNGPTAAWDESTDDEVVRFRRVSEG